jgi:hypothetical protein
MGHRRRTASGAGRGILFPKSFRPGIRREHDRGTGPGTRHHVNPVRQEESAVAGSNIRRRGEKDDRRHCR